MSFGKKSQDPWDRKPRFAAKRPSEPAETPEPKKSPLESLRAWNEQRKAEKEQTRRLPPETCPWCGQEMEQGYLFTGRDHIYWSPGWMETFAAFFGSPAASRLRIDDEGKWVTSKTAWLCRNCKKMVFDMPEDDFPGTETDNESREEDS